MVITRRVLSHVCKDLSLLAGLFFRYTISMQTFCSCVLDIATCTLPHTSLCFVFSISAPGRGNMMAAPARDDEVCSYHFTGGADQKLGVGRREWITTQCVAGHAKPSGSAQITARNCLSTIADVATAVEVRDPNLICAFHEFRALLGLTEITLDWWEQRFGTVSLEAIYGERFWHGFSTIFREYIASSKLCLPPGEKFRIALFRKPADFAQDVVSRPQSDDNPADPDENALVPCYTRYSHPQFNIVISICTVISMSTPWTVHRSWLIFFW